ncbi:MAG: helix-turn-helix transcriptional regulator, partial [Gammaproteobacteria bacterium]|nr:helix-turn-helix transcriptional regulator [Gammaproteobacteria bacterium]
MRPHRRGRPRHPDILTPGEWRVLEALRAGGTNADIGGRLGISADAVKYHISNMLGKLDLQSREELAAWSRDRGRRRLSALHPAVLAAAAQPLVWGGVLVGALGAGTVAVVLVFAYVPRPLPVVGTLSATSEPTPEA